MTLAPHPGRLALLVADGALIVQISVTPDPYEVRLDYKPAGNIDHIASSTYQRTLGRPSHVRPEPARSLLFIGRTTIELQPQQVPRAKQWCDAYAEWLRNGDLDQPCPGHWSTPA